MTALPQLERELRLAARRRLERRRRRVWRTGAAVAIAGAAVAATAAASGWLTVDRGTTSRGEYEIRVTPRAPAPQQDVEVAALDGRRGQICLELRFASLRPSYGCGVPPTSGQPIGVVVVDQNAEPGKRLTYGLVSDETASVVIGSTTTATTERDGLPGRFFSALTAARGTVHIVALDAAGRRLGEVGSATASGRKPHGLDDARAMGDPSGFAPTARPPSAFVYRGREISSDEAAHRGLACVEDESPIVRCYRTPEEADRAHGPP